MINSIPRKSSSLILTKYIPKSQEFYNYKILILKRTSQGSFPNVYAFPGGNYDVKKDEKIINESNNVNFPLENLKNTALRETLEELGLLFVDINSNEYGIMDEIKEKLIKNNKNWYDFNEIHSILNKNEEISPFIRLITIPFLNPRYDTQFFFHHINDLKTINFRNFYEKNIKFNENSIKDWNENINFDKTEFSEMVWLNPLEILQNYYEKKDFLLAPPQFLIINIMSHFNNIKHFQAFLNTRKKMKLINDPFTFPNMFCLLNTDKIRQEKKKEGFDFVTLCGGDCEYPVKEVAEKEKDENLQKEIIYKYNNFGKETKFQQKNRIFFTDKKSLFKKKFEVDIMLNSINPFNFLKSYDDINNLIKKLYKK